ncbi:MAG: hypothetical protein AAGF83_00345 [Cyanobacteria bacterium P01_G01_bin.67]
MKRKFGTLLLGLAVTIGLTNYFSDRLWQPSAIAQPAPEEFSLEPMDMERLDAILQEQVAGNIATQPGQWRFSINEISIIVLADPNANRMRIFSPVMNAEELTSEQIQKMMLANFHTALDARYAISNGFVVTTFIHPLYSLQERDLLSALNQVSSLTATFGTSYSSGELLFVPRGNGNGDNPPPPPGQSSPEDVNARKLVLNSKTAPL